jgi:hypothetical protein
MTTESKHLTPDHTNMVETSHMGRNMETSIRAPILTAINEFVLSTNSLQMMYTDLFYIRNYQSTSPGRSTGK